MSISGTCSPFRISKDDEKELGCNVSFASIREYLAKNRDVTFCSSHGRDILGSEKDIFRLHRDVTYALFLPLLQIYAQASHIASCSLPDRSLVDLELAFSGDARSSYSWLQCLLTEERDWCLTRGCPACVVLRVFHSEPLIRMVVVACQTSEYLKSTGCVEYQLPSFAFWLQALRKAVQEDPFWGDGFWEDIMNRASAVEMGIRPLILQCFDLRNAQSALHRRLPCPPEKASTSTNQQYSTLIPVKTSVFTRRQLRMKLEEEARLSRLVTSSLLTASFDDVRRDPRMATGKQANMLALPNRMRPVTF